MTLPEEDIGVVERLRQRGEQTLARARELLGTCDWRLVSENRSSGDTVHWVTIPGMGRVLLLTAMYNCSTDHMWQALCGDIENVPKWCKVFATAKVLKIVDSQTDVLYHETHPGGGGLVSARDWITLRHWERGSDSFQQAAVAIDFPLTEHKKHTVRGETVISLYSVSKMTPSDAAGETDEGSKSSNEERCRLHFMSCCRMGGWLPMKVIERFYVASCLKLASDLRQQVEDLTMSDG